MQDYNLRLVVLGTAVLGAACGIIGSLMLLRKRSLVGDAVSHACLPGIVAAFLVQVALGGDGRSLPLLLLGAAAGAVAGVGAMLALRRWTRLRDDASMAAVLSVGFGAGVALLGVATRMGQGHAAGLEGFIYGRTASMVASDAMLIGAAAGAVLLVAASLWKELRLLCFDEAFARAQGWPVLLLDAALMLLVIGVTVIGLQAVGLILVVALLVIPAAAARFWTERMSFMTLLAALGGALSAVIGTGLSSALPRLPSGAMIVLVAAALFAVSMVAGVRRGVAARWWRRWAFERTVARQNLLRALQELAEDGAGAADGAPGRGPQTPDGRRAGVAFSRLLGRRSWSPRRLRGTLRAATREGLVRLDAQDELRLTESGAAEAARLVRRHRLWELFLIRHADIAPSHVDRDADAIEHVLSPGMLAALEAELGERSAAAPASPHPLAPAEERP